MSHLTCGLIGENIGRSRLAKALEIMCNDHGLGFSFTPIDTAGQPDFDFDAQVAALVLQGWTGVTVTHPWKTHAALWAGEQMAADVRGLGASNTLLFNPAMGFNTDYTGFRAAWEHVMKQTPGRVAVAGAGGVARAIVPALFALGASDIAIWDRDAERAEALASRTGARAVPMDQAAGESAAANGLVNCTPRGMAPDAGSAFEAAWIGGQDWAFDAVYTPTMTPFLTDCAAKGLSILTGFDLFRFMAMRSFCAYTGIRVDPAQTLPKLDALRPE